MMLVMFGLLLLENIVLLCDRPTDHLTAASILGGPIASATVLRYTEKAVVGVPCPALREVP